MISPRLLIALIPAFLPLVPLPARALTVPVPLTFLRPNGTLSTIGERCSSSRNWIGPGVSLMDCEMALEELLLDDVQRAEKQEFEFYTRGAPRLDFPLPLVITPRTHEYGRSRGIKPSGAEGGPEVA